MKRIFTSKLFWAVALGLALAFFFRASIRRFGHDVGNNLGLSRSWRVQLNSSKPEQYIAADQKKILLACEENLTDSCVLADPFASLAAIGSQVEELSITRAQVRALSDSIVRLSKLQRLDLYFIHAVQRANMAAIFAHPPLRTLRISHIDQEYNPLQSMGRTMRPLQVPLREVARNPMLDFRLSAVPLTEIEQYLTTPDAPVTGRRLDDERDLGYIARRRHKSQSLGDFPSVVELYGDYYLMRGLLDTLFGSLASPHVRDLRLYQSRLDSIPLQYFPNLEYLAISSVYGLKKFPEFNPKRLKRLTISAIELELPDAFLDSMPKGAVFVFDEFSLDSKARFKVLTTLPKSNPACTCAEDLFNNIHLGYLPLLNCVFEKSKQNILTPTELQLIRAQKRGVSVSMAFPRDLELEEY